MVIPNPKFNIGDRIFHVTRDSDEGVIVNAMYYIRQRNWTYTVTFSPGSEHELFEDEIMTSKIY